MSLIVPSLHTPMAIVTPLKSCCSCSFTQFARTIVESPTSLLQKYLTLAWDAYPIQFYLLVVPQLVGLLHGELCSEVCPTLSCFLLPKVVPLRSLSAAPYPAACGFLLVVSRDPSFCGSWVVGVYPLLSDSNWSLSTRLVPPSFVLYLTFHYWKQYLIPTVSVVSVLFCFQAYPHSVFIYVEIMSLHIYDD